MKKQLLLLVGLLILLALLVRGFGMLGITFWGEEKIPAVSFPEGDETFSRNGESWIRHVDSGIGIVFEYRDSPDGYQFLESDGLEGKEHQKTIVLMPKSGYLEMRESEVPLKDPSMSLLAFKNTEKLSLRQWAEKHNSVSNLSLRFGEPSDTVLAGAKAIRYRADGLYPMEVVIATHEDMVFVVSGSYLEETSVIRRDFGTLLDSIRFVPVRSTSFRDGKHLGFIHAMVTGTKGYVEFDDAVWLSGKAGQDAAIEAGVCTEATRSECLPNDYFIKNAVVSDETIPLSANASVVMQTFGMEESGGVAEREIGLADFAGLVNNTKLHWRKLPYTITVSKGAVTRIEEVYIP